MLGSCTGVVAAGRLIPTATPCSASRSSVAPASGRSHHSSTTRSKAGRTGSGGPRPARVGTAGLPADRDPPQLPAAGRLTTPGPSGAVLPRSTARRLRVRRQKNRRSSGSAPRRRQPATRASPSIGQLRRHTGGLVGSHAAASRRGPTRRVRPTMLRFPSTFAFCAASSRNQRGRPRSRARGRPGENVRIRGDAHMRCGRSTVRILAASRPPQCRVRRAPLQVRVARLHPVQAGRTTGIR